MTRKAFENAITVVITLGGSTNAVLHLLAMAHTANVELDLMISLKLESGFQFFATSNQVVSIICLTSFELVDYAHYSRLF
jgi:hypothetical protein